MTGIRKEVSHMNNMHESPKKKIDWKWLDTRLSTTSLGIVHYVFSSNSISAVQWGSMLGLAYVYFQTKDQSTVVRTKGTDVPPVGAF